MPISGHIISFRFLPISGLFQITRENQSQSIWSRWVNCNWGKKIFFRLSPKDRFFEPIEKKSLTPLTTGEPVSATMSIALFWLLQDTLVYIFLLLYFVLVFLLIMQSQPTSIAWTATSTAAFFIIVEVTRNILIYELDALRYVIFTHA